jgi:hypothetical protein
LVERHRERLDATLTEQVADLPCEQVVVVTVGQVGESPCCEISDAGVLQVAPLRTGSP